MISNMSSNELERLSIEHENEDSVESIEDVFDATLFLKRIDIILSGSQFSRLQVIELDYRLHVTIPESSDVVPYLDEDPGIFVMIAGTQLYMYNGYLNASGHLFERYVRRVASKLEKELEQLIASGVLRADFTFVLNEQ